MPLPEATLSLGPLTSPDGTEPVKPKVAMLVRLSSATIDALTSVMNDKEKVSVDLGSTPGIHIDGTFYPLRRQKEETPHEIYLRAPRGNGLKLYANVAEKLFIAHNEIGDDLKDKIRETTLEFARQRGDRRTKLIEAPPTQPAKVVKKKKESALAFRNPIRPSDQVKLDISTSSVRASSPASRPSKKLPSTSASSDLSSRLIRCMAMKNRTRDMIVKLVSGDNTSIRRDIIDLIEEIGEPISPLKKGEDAGSKIWCLKTESWLHVRPMEWPNLTTQERLQLSRTGRMRLATLGYSDKDPEWSPFAYRSADTNAVPEKSTSMSSGDTRKREKPDPPAKSGISSSEVKRPKTKSDPNAEIPMRDESSKATPRVSSSTTKTKDGARSISPAKKVPGSGFVAGKSGTRDANSVADGSNKEAKLPRQSLPHKAMAPPQTTRTDKATGNVTTHQHIKKVRGSDASFGSESERDRDVRSKPSVKSEERHGVEAPTLKRRNEPRDSHDSDASTNLPAPQKKRKTENGAVATSTSSKDMRSFPKKPEIAPPPRQKPCKEPASPSSVAPSVAPPLPRINKKANSSLRPNTTSDVNKTPLPESTSSALTREVRGRSEVKVSGKRRRGSPIYTSSEDEREDGKIRRITQAQSPAAETGNYSQSRRREQEREPRPLPTDHASLRMRYTATYGQCMAALTTLLAQKSRIDSMLRHADTGSVTESDGEGELMDVEDLKKLSSDYERMHEELETIRQKFAEQV